MPSNKRPRAPSAAGVVGRIAGVLLVVIAAVYALARATDTEKLDIDDATRTAAAKAYGGAYIHGRDGITHYEVAGPDSAPLVVLAAGASVPGYIWQPTFDSLKNAGYHVMRYDYFGRGWSDRPDIPLVQDVYVNQLIELLDSLHSKKPITLAGLSYGGTVITSFAAAHPDRVGALVYVDPGIHEPRHIPALVRWRPIGDLVFQWNSRTWASGQLDDFLHPERYPDWSGRYAIQMQYKGFRRGRWSDAVANADLDTRNALAEVGKNPRPVLVLWGKQDRTVPIERSKALLAALPRAQFVPVDSAGHLPQWEQQAVTHAALFAFLRENAARAK